MEAVIYSNGNQECERAKILLEKLNFQIQIYKLNQHFSERGFVEEFGEEDNDTGINIDTDSTINAELSNADREGLITTLRGRKLLTDGELNRRDVIRLVDCIS